MLIKNIFYYQGDFMFLMWKCEFMKSLKIDEFFLLNIFYLKATNGSP